MNLGKITVKQLIEKVGKLKLTLILSTLISIISGIYTFGYKTGVQDFDGSLVSCNSEVKSKMEIIEDKDREIHILNTRIISLEHDFSILKDLYNFKYLKFKDSEISLTGGGQ